MPPPTQPPPAVVEHLQQTDRKIKTQQETQRDGQWRGGNKREGGGQWRGGEGGKREGGQWRGGEGRRENRGGDGEREGGEKPCKFFEKEVLLDLSELKKGIL